MSTLLTGIELYYKLDESSGTTAFDSVGSKNGTLIGSPTFVGGGKINNGLYYDNSNRRHIDIGTQIDGSFWDGDFSVSFWYKADSFTVVPAYFITYNRDITLSVATTVLKDKFSFGIWDGSTFHQAIQSDTLSTGIWYNITSTRSKTDGMKVYVNGTIKGSNAFTGNGVTTTGGDFNSTKIGRRFDATRDYRLDGLLDEVGIRSKALTASEVTELYNGGAGLQYPFKKSNGNFLLMF